jgi:hypothetical protein
MSGLLLIAVASAFWPGLVGVVLVALRAEHPGRLMGSFLAAGLLTTMTVGLVFIYVLRGTGLTSGSSKSWFGPTVQIAVGALAVAAAAILERRRTHRAPKVTPAQAGRIERMLDRGAPLAFLAGVLFNIAPGVMPILGMETIAEMNKSFAVTFALLFGFFVVMFTTIEIPLAGYLVAPERTAAVTLRVNAWLDRNAYRFAVRALAIVGVYLIVRGAAHLVI